MIFNLIKQPQPINWSGNPVKYSFAADVYGPAQQQQDIRIQVKILKELGYNTNTYQLVDSLFILPDTNGVCSVNIGSVADAYLSYFLPNINWPAGARCDGQSGRFKISYRVIVGNLPHDEVTTDPIVVLKGGLPYDGLEIHQNWVTANLKDYVILSTLATFTQQQRGFISVLYKGSTGHTPKIRFLVNHYDGSATTVIIPFTQTVKKGDIICIPFKAVADFNQPFVKDFKSATLEVFADDFIGTALLTQTTKWSFKRGPFNNLPFGKYLFFINSSGGLDSLYAYGNNSNGGEYTQTVNELYQASSGPKQLPQSMADDASVINNGTANTGFIAKADEVLIRSLFLCKAAFLLEGETDFKSLLPIIVTKKKHSGPDSDDFLYSATIEWQEANRQQFFSQLSIGAINPGTCPALLSFSAVWQNGLDVRVSWAMPLPYNQLQITDGTDTYILSGNAGSALITMATGSTGTYTITGKCYCGDDWVTDAWVPSLGPASTMDITIGANLPPIAVDDSFYVPAGITILTPLIGNVLTNDSDPEGQAIECVPAAGFTLQGGNYTLAANGTVSYKPLTAGFTGLDEFNYSIREVADYASTASAVVKLLVNQSVAIYARVERVLGASSGGSTPNQRATYYLRYYSNPGCTNPLNVTAYNLTINYRKIESQFYFDGTPVTSPVNTHLTIAATGAENILATNIYYMQYFIATYHVIDFTALPGVGYTAL